MIQRRQLIQMQEEVESRVQDLDFVKSATLIGPSPDERRIEKVMDLDTLLIVQDHLRKDQFSKIEEIFSSMMRFSEPDLDVIYAIANGPMKPKSEKENEVFYHVLLMTENGYITSPLRLAQISWQYEKPFFGESPSAYYSRDRLTRDILVNSPMGLKNCESMVKNNRTAYFGFSEWEDNPDILIPDYKPTHIRLNDIGEKLELYFYSILRCASNTLRWRLGNNHIGIEADMCDLFAKANPNFEYNQVPAMTHASKRLLRNRNLPINQGLVEFYQKLTIDFLSGLREFI